MFGRPWAEFGAGPRLACAGGRCALGADLGALFAGGALCGAGGAFFCSVCWARAKDEAMSKTRMAHSFTRMFLLLLFNFIEPSSRNEALQGFRFMPQVDTPHNSSCEIIRGTSSCEIIRGTITCLETNRAGP